jgi:cyclic-di-GMP phosphodiesterase TipF (flagellum assembly factor)
MRLGAIFVAACIVLTAGSIGAVAYFAFGVTRIEAVIVAVATLTALSLYNLSSAWLAARTVVASPPRAPSHGDAGMARQIADLEQNFAALEQRVEAALDKTRAATNPLAAEFGEMSTLLRHLAETVSTHETKLSELGRAPTPTKAAATPVRSEPVRSEPAPAVRPPVAAAAPPAEPAPDARRRSAPDPVLTAIGAAVDANRIDLYLQPIVTLPQRKVRYYEAVSRLRTHSGDIMSASNFVAPAEAGGLMPKIDNLAIFRCVQVVRRLLIKNREIGLFCNLSGASLTDAAAFPQLLEFLDANRAIAPSLVLEFTQSALRAAGPMENESLAALAECGFRFSLDNVTDLRFEPRELATRGFRFVKIPAPLLLNRNGATLSDIDPADLPGLLARFGIDLIAEKIESEGAVVDLLDFDVKFGQGFLFSLPRPVRAEALQGIAEPADAAEPEASVAGAVTAGASLARPLNTVTGNGRRPSAFAQIARRV